MPHVDEPAHRWIRDPRLRVLRQYEHGPPFRVCCNSYGQTPCTHFANLTEGYDNCCRWCPRGHTPPCYQRQMHMHLQLQHFLLDVKDLALAVPQTHCPDASLLQVTASEEDTIEQNCTAAMPVLSPLNASEAAGSDSHVHGTEMATVATAPVVFHLSPTLNI